MKSLVNLFTRKPSFKLTPRQVVELEFEFDDGSLQVCACEVHDVQRRKVLLTPLQGQRPSVAPGQKVRICSLQGDQFQAAFSQLVQFENGAFELTPPGSEFEELAAPKEDTLLKVTLAAEYRAMRMPNTQKGDVVEVRGNVLTMVTNMKIPPHTELHVSLNLPDWGRTISSQAKTLNSLPVEGTRKHHTEVELDALSEEDRKLLWRCACLQHCRRITREKIA